MEDIIPVIDFSSLCHGPNGATEAVREKVASQIFKAMSQVGFMYILNHGVDAEKIDAVFKESVKFFALPDPTKEKYDVDLSQGHHKYEGYTKPGQQILNENYSYEIRECLSFDNPGHDLDIKEVPTLVPAVDQLRRSCQPLIRTILMLVGKALKLEDENYFLQALNAGNLNQIHTLNRSMMRTNWYPAIPVDVEIPKKSIRCSEHTDYGILTLLFQDEVGGLEVKRSDGKWIQATPIPGSVLVNTGDVLQFWTGGVLPATPHQILIPQKEIQLRSNRQSVVYFVHADDNAVITPINSPMIKYQEQHGFQPFPFKEHYERRMNTSYGV